MTGAQGEVREGYGSWDCKQRGEDVPAPSHPPEEGTTDPGGTDEKESFQVADDNRH